MKWILAIVLSCLVLLLSWQNSRLRHERDRLAIESSKPKAGTWIPDIQSKLGDIPSGPRIGSIYVFLEPNCEYSNASLPMINELHETVVRRYGEKIRLVGVTSVANASSKHYFRQKNSFAIHSTSDPGILSYPKAYGTPLVVVSDARGIVFYARFGLLSSMDDVNDVMDSLLLMERGIGSTNLESNDGEA